MEGAAGLGRMAEGEFLGVVADFYAWWLACSEEKKKAVGDFYPAHTDFV